MPIAPRARPRCVRRRGNTIEGVAALTPATRSAGTRPLPSREGGRSMAGTTAAPMSPLPLWGRGARGVRSVSAIVNPPADEAELEHREHEDDAEEDEGSGGGVAEAGRAVEGVVDEDGRQLGRAERSAAVVQAHHVDLIER